MATPRLNREMTYFIRRLPTGCCEQVDAAASQRAFTLIFFARAVSSASFGTPFEGIVRGKF
jgi:hypothetical protein